MSNAKTGSAMLCLKTVNTNVYLNSEYGFVYSGSTNKLFVDSINSYTETLQKRTTN